MVNTSLKSNVEVDYLIPTFFPKDVRWENYPNAMRYASFAAI